MTRSSKIFAIVAAVFLGIGSLSFAQPAPEFTELDESGAAVRRSALELAGAFANDGYKLRDGYLVASLKVGEPILLEVNLFTGNEYWFTAATTAPAKKISVSVFNDAGALLNQQLYQGDTQVAAGVEPPVSGRYYVQVALLEGEPAPFCLVYSYK